MPKVYFVTLAKELLCSSHKTSESSQTVISVWPLSEFCDNFNTLSFSCINVRLVSREMLKTECEARGFRHLPGNLANVNGLKNVL